MDRPAHPKPDLERILKEIEAGGWRVDRPGKYFRCRCSCGSHMTHVHLTPSNPRHGSERLKFCQRFDCWKGQK